MTLTSIYKINKPDREGLRKARDMKLQKDSAEKYVMQVVQGQPKGRKEWVFLCKDSVEEVEIVEATRDEVDALVADGYTIVVIKKP